MIYVYVHRRLSSKYKYEIAAREAHARILKIGLEVIEKERTQEYNPTFIQNLVKSEGALKLTDQQIVSNVITFFFAGSDTTSSALTWTFFLLTQHPSVIEEMRNEVDHLIPEVEAGRLTVEGFMDSIVLTKACFTEATRIYSPAGTIPSPATTNTSYSLYLPVYAM